MAVPRSGRAAGVHARRGFTVSEQSNARLRALPGEHGPDLPPGPRPELLDSARRKSRRNNKRGPVARRHSAGTRLGCRPRAVFAGMNETEARAIHVIFT